MTHGKSSLPNIYECPLMEWRMATLTTHLSQKAITMKHHPSHLSDNWGLNSSGESMSICGPVPPPLALTAYWYGERIHRYGTDTYYMLSMPSWVRPIVCIVPSRV